MFHSRRYRLYDYANNATTNNNNHNDNDTNSNNNTTTTTTPNDNNNNNNDNHNTNTAANALPDSGHAARDLSTSALAASCRHDTTTTSYERLCKQPHHNYAASNIVQTQHIQHK